MKTVFKYELHPNAEEVEMPLGAEILSVAFQGDIFCMWALVDSSAVMVERTFHVFGTGHEIPTEMEGYLQFIGTAFMGTGFVFHAFELVAD